nr:uncharacterized mitochondrial protein AtMg00810-like [Tanacetum cinerariifolium]
TKPHNKTLYELLHGRTPSIGFMRPFDCLVTILNTLDFLGKFEGKVDEGILVGYSNNDGDATFDGKEHDFDAKKPESEVSVSPSSSAQSRKQDDKTKKEVKGKSHVESFTRYRDVSAEFEDCSDNSINEVNAVGTIVPTVRQNSPNSTNTFSTVGPSNATASPTYGKSSLIDASQLLDDRDMLELEDITYSDEEGDVGAKADFNNLETSITVSPIPPTRVHKDHPVSQIIGDLSLTTQIRSMTRVVQDQGGLLQMFNDDFHTFYIKLLELGMKPWYETLANYLLGNGFPRGNIDQTLFIKRQKGDIMLVQIYVDDIIFGATNKDLYKSFEKLMKDKFQMSSMGELTFFLGLQVKQKKDEIFISQDKYVAEILRKFRLTEGKSGSIPIDTEKPLLKDPDGEEVDVHTYRLMIGSLMYLTSSRPDIMFAVCACARFQVTQKASHLHAVKRIFRYLKGKPHLGLWYPKDSPFDLVAYSDSDYAGAILDRKSTTGGCQFLRCRLISWQCKKQTVVASSSTEAEYVAATRVNTPRSDEDRLELIEFTVFLLPKDEKVEIGVNFWTTVAVKQVNDVTGLQALVDRKKNVHQEHCQLEARGRPSTGSGKLPEEAQPDEARHGRMIAEMDQDDAVVLKDDKDKDKDKEAANSV